MPIFTNVYIQILTCLPDFIAVFKPSGMHVHPTKEARADDQILLTLLENQLGQKLYPLHRLDRATSGIVLFALSSQAATSLSPMFSDHQIQKDYLCLVKGHPPKQGLIDRPLKKIDSDQLQAASTQFHTLKYLGDYALVLARPKHGRRHQIRRHLKGIHHPLVGDTTYGKGPINRMFRDEYMLSRLFLHASRLTFNWNNQEIIIECPLPADLENCTKLLAERFPDQQHNLIL